LPTYLVITFFSLVTLNKVFFQDVIGMYRVSTGIVLTALYCVPRFDSVSNRSRFWLTICAVLWLMPVALFLIVSALQPVTP
jgi:hypothetical protein